MERNLKIAVLGDFNYTYNSHHATNLSMNHAADFLEMDCDIYWLGFNEYIQNKSSAKNYYDAYWIAPGPYRNDENLNKTLELLLATKKPVLITGIAFKNIIELLADQYAIRSNDEKIISDNILAGTTLEKVELNLQSTQLRKLYEYYSKIELTDNRFSLYPGILEQLMESVIDLEAYNQYNTPEIISLKNRNFFVATQCYPQISSTRENPHPLIYTFLKAILIKP